MVPSGPSTVTARWLTDTSAQLKPAICMVSPYLSESTKMPLSALMNRPAGYGWAVFSTRVVLAAEMNPSAAATLPSPA
jgi:hypothetical protein